MGHHISDHYSPLLEVAAPGTWIVEVWDIIAMDITVHKNVCILVIDTVVVMMVIASGHGTL